VGHRFACLAHYQLFPTRTTPMNFRKVLGPAATIFSLFPTAVVSQTLGAAGPIPGAGKEIFARRCSGCHATDSNQEGPRLRGVLGRKAGTVAGYPYSDALRNSGITWTGDLLNKWLENPEALVRDNDMEFRVSNAAERAALVAYLKSLTN
jgi:cytochrome c2